MTRTPLGARVVFRARTVPEGQEARPKRLWVVFLRPSGTQPKRLYALGQYSRFIRPSWIRVDTVTNPATNAYLSAFKNPAGNQIAVVAINAGTSQVPLALTIDSGRFGALASYRTSASENLASVDAVAAGATVNVTLAPSSVTTFVGPVTP